MIIIVTSLWHHQTISVLAARRNKTVAPLIRVTLFEQVEAVTVIRLA
jgi:hypothetical protein